MVFNPHFGERVEFPQVEELPGRSNRMIKVLMDGGAQGMGTVQKLTICIFFLVHQIF